MFPTDGEKGEKLREQAIVRANVTPKFVRVELKTLTVIQNVIQRKKLAAQIPIDFFFRY